MSDQTIIEQCAPTLAGIKTGSLFSVKFPDEKTAVQEIRELNKKIRSKGLRAIPVGVQKKRTLIYLYRPEDLRRDFENPEVLAILKDRGYPCESVSGCIVQLVKRLAGEKDFPHEIGLFLGYPPCDVRGFINSPKDGVKFVGYWKVYGDPNRARQLFAKYKKCTQTFRKNHRLGVSLSQLAVTSI
ncbi:MAG: DUF3793 family protein [Lachnospiraceae bacterium]|nr:DUF3793 family protein [Lachnospiraceae bacterium]